MDKKYGIFKKYRKIIFAVILFMVADALVIAINFINTYKADESAVSINLSGRQRMLSQRTTKVLLILDRSLDAQDDALVKANLKELTLAVGLFDTTLRGFRDGAMVTGGDGNPVFLTQVETEKSRGFVTDAYKIWDPYLQLLRPFLARDKQFSDPELTEMLQYVKSHRDQLEEVVSYAQRNNLEILRLMNDLTTDLEFVANERAATLRIVLIIGIAVALINFGYTVVVSIRDLLKSDAELAKARGETIEILSTVHEGLFLLDRDKRMGTQFSESLPGILRRTIEPGMDFMPVLEAIAPKNIHDAAMDYIELLLGDRVKESLVTSLNPLTNVPIIATDPLGNSQTRYLSFFFNRVLSEGEISHLLVTVQDVTDKVVLMQQVEQAKSQAKTEVETLLRLASNDFDALRLFINNVGQSLGQINEKLSEPHDDVRDRLHTLNYVMRIVHGIKGEAAVLGIEVLEAYAHECEKEMVAMRESENPANGDQMVRIAVLLEGFYQRYSSLAQIVSRFGEAFGKTQPGRATGTEVAKTHPFVERITTLAQRIAADHGKQIEVSCQLDKLYRLPETVVQELQGISIQLVRNALTHGIEATDERTAHSKPESGALCLWCEYLGNGLYDFTVRDDGRGIVPDRLRQHFVKSGRMSAKEAAALSDQDIANRIFLPGISTVETADKDAGHGVGLDAVLERVKNISGHLLVRSRANLFTEFHIQFTAS